MTIKSNRNLTNLRNLKDAEHLIYYFFAEPLIIPTPKGFYQPTILLSKICLFLFQK